MNIGKLDLLLLLAVTGQSMLLAYLPQPRLKALLLTLPVPFTIATLAVGRPVDATNVLGMLVLMVFTNAVRWFYQGLKLRIIPAIFLSALLFCILGTGVAWLTPTTDKAFWWAALAVLTAGALCHLAMPHRDEPAHRSPLPPWQKALVIAGVITFIVLLKQLLRGTMTTFPMVGVVAAYEARHSLWTISRQIPVVIFTMLPMMAVCRLLQGSMGLGWALVCSWGVFLAVLIPLTRYRWRQERAAGSQAGTRLV